MGTSSSRRIIAGRRQGRLPEEGSAGGTRSREERRRLGSYYTPAPLVNHLVRAALGPLLPHLRRTAAAAHGGRLDDVALPRLLDPAMGDGLFLQTAAELIAATLSTAARRTIEEIRPHVLARCLAGVDIDPVAVSLARQRLGAGAALIHDDFLAEGTHVDGPFDIVLGNPPWGGWNRILDHETKLELRARFATARGLIDPFALFLERCTGMLAPGGRLAMVLPDYFLLKNYPAARRHVLENYVIEELVHWGRAFADVNLDACTMVAVRAPAPARGGPVRCMPEGPGGRIIRTPQSRFAAAPGCAFNLSLDARGAALLRRLERDGVALGGLLEAHEGIHTGNIRRKLFVPPGAEGSCGRPLRPLVLGRGEIRPFRLRLEGWRVVYDPSAIDRSRGDYASLGRESWYTGPKILVRRTGDVVIAALDRQGLYASNNLFVALPRAGCSLPLEYLEGYLNSSLATWCFRAIQPRAGRLFAELKLVHLNRLPVPVPRDAGRRRAIGRVVNLVRRIRRMFAGDDGAAPFLASLDAAFARMAHLTPAERRLVARKTFPPPRASPL